MDKSFRAQEVSAQERGGLFASLRMLDRILKWMAGFVQLTEEEQKAAGIYLDHQRYED